MISVIIPTYNRESTIERSVRSVLEQSYRDIELIVVDDCSTDNTKRIIQAIEDDRLQYICHEKNQGACAARNTGISAAKGEYIAFQDSDDMWLPNKLEVQLKAIESTGADVCVCRVMDYGFQKGTHLFEPLIEDSCFLEYSILSRRPMIGTQTFFARKDVFDKCQFDVKVKKAQDFDWVLRAGRSYSFYYVNDVLAVRFLQNDSISKGGYEKSLAAHTYFLEKYKAECEADPAFWVARLRLIGRIKAKLGRDCRKEFTQIYKLTGTKKDFVKHILAKMRLMSLVYMVDGKYRAYKTEKKNASLMRTSEYKKIEEYLSGKGIVAASSIK